MKNYNAFVLPSTWYENAPLSIVEAAMSGLRILTVNEGGMKEMGELCEDAYFFSYEDPKSLLKAISLLKEDVLKKSPMKRNMEKLEDTFSINSFVKRHLKVYGL